MKTNIGFATPESIDIFEEFEVFVEPFSDYVAMSLTNSNIVHNSRPISSVHSKKSEVLNLI